MEILFLGTACMQPTKERNQQGALIIYKEQNILLDCGEGTQRQMKIAGVKPAKLTKILITHWHGDHVLGLPGLLQTMGASEYNKTLEIYGPKGTKKYFEHLMNIFDVRDFVKFKIIEVNDGKIFENDDFVIESFELKHGVRNVAYTFTEKDRLKIKVADIKKLGLQEGPLLGRLQKGQDIKFKGKTIKSSDCTYTVPGRKIAYVVDTLFCNNAVKAAQNADILICESVYTSKLKDKAEEYKHMTAKDAGMLANQANAKRLLLTHFSQRYKTTEEIEEDAKSVFEDVVCTYDFMRIKL